MKPSLASLLSALSFLFAPTAVCAADPVDTRLIGHWRMTGNARDYSSHSNDGVNHGVIFAAGKAGGVFDGVKAFIEVPNTPAMRLGTNDFAFCAWIHTEKDLDDAVGDLFSKFDPARRRGVTLAVNSSASGYLSQSSDRHVYF